MVETTTANLTNPPKAVHELGLEIVKHIIALKIAEHEAKRNKEARAAERARLVDALANKQD